MVPPAPAVQCKIILQERSIQVLLESMAHKNPGHVYESDTIDTNKIVAAGLGFKQFSHVVIG